jgi:hypothetical protein
MRGSTTWFPEIDVFERDNRLVSRIDLPGVKKDDVKVEIADGHLAKSGERKAESGDKTDDYHCCEREYGNRTVPLPKGGQAGRCQGNICGRRARGQPPDAGAARSGGPERANRGRAEGGEAACVALIGVVTGRDLYLDTRQLTPWDPLAGSATLMAQHERAPEGSGDRREKIPS